MAKDYQYSGWWARPAAVMYALTVGLFVGAILLIVGSVYGIVGTVLRLINYGDVADHSTWTRRPISGPVSDTMGWWAALFHYAATGRGEFKVAPEFS